MISGATVEHHRVQVVAARLKCHRPWYKRPSLQIASLGGPSTDSGDPSMNDGLPSARPRARGRRQMKSDIVRPVTLGDAGDSRSRLQRHWRGLASALGGALVGLVIGFAAGGYLACAPSIQCEFRADLAGALGTWVGGLGTIGAVVFAIIAFRSEEASRRREEQARFDEAERERNVELERRIAERQALQQKRELERRDANLVSIAWEFGGGVNATITELRLVVTNGASATSVHHLRGRSIDYGKIGEAHTVKAGDSHRRIYKFGAFGRDGDPIPMPDSLPTWLREYAETVTISFEMYGRRWRRKGTSAVEPQEYLGEDG